MGKDGIEKHNSSTKTRKDARIMKMKTSNLGRESSDDIEKYGSGFVECNR